VLRRTGFKRPERPARAPVVLVPLTRRGVAAPVPSDVRAVPKLDLVRSPKLREAFRLIPCQWPGCGRDDGTVVCAHSNALADGKGKGMKAGDDRGASLCYRCHCRLDQGSELSREERRAGWLAAHVASVQLLVARGLWPAHVPVPDLTAA
jgi:hypothetical protein